MADVLAEAVVELEADVNKFNKDFKRSLKEAEKDAQKSTNEIDKSFKQLTGNLGKEFERASQEIARQYREQEREAARVQREIEAEAKRVQREIERETLRVQKEIERETTRVARENAKAQKEYEVEFIATQRATEKAARESQERQAAQFRQHVATLRKFASERLSLTLGVDTSQIKSALGTASKLGAVLGGIGIGAIAGQASLAGIANITLALQDLIGVVALLPAVGSSAGVVVATLTLGLRGLGDAISADKPEKFAEALEQLSDNGKKFVKTVRDLKDEFDDLGKRVQNELLAGFNEEVERLAKTLLPVLQKGFVGVARELNASALSLAEFVRQGQTVRDIERVFTNTQQAVFVFRRSLAPLAQAFRDLTAVGSDFLPVIAADLGGVAKRFSDFIAQARESGNLVLIFENAIRAVRNLFAILGNVGGIFDAFLDNARLAFGDQGFLGFLLGVTERFEEFVRTIEGQVAILNFFKNVQTAVNAVLPIIDKLAKVIFQQVLPAFAQLGTVAAPGLSALVDGLSRGLQDAIPGIVSFVESLASVVTTLVNAGVLDALGELVRVLGTTLGAALRAIAPKLADLVNSILLKLTEILPKILPALAKFAGAFADLVIAALPVVDVLADIVSSVGLPTLQRIAEKLTPVIARLAEGLGEVLLPILPDLTDAFADWVDAMAPVVDEILIALVDLLKDLAPLLPSIVRSSVELAKAALPLVKFFGDLAEVVSKVVTKLYEIPGVKKFMDEQLPGILALLTGTLIIPLGKLFDAIDKVVTKLNEAGVFDLFTQSLTGLGMAITGIGQIFISFGQFVNDTIEFLKLVARVGVDFIALVFTTGFEGIKNFFIMTWETIKTVFNTAWEYLKSIVRSAVQFVLSIITSGFNALPSVVQGALGRLRDVALEQINRFLDIIRDIPRRIREGFSNPSGLLVDIGRDVVRGFINGIQSMINALANEAANMAKTALNAAKNALLSRSPSRAMIVVGQDFGEGFVIGIEKMLRKASEAGSDLASETVRASVTTLAPTDNEAAQLNAALNRITRNGLSPVPTAQLASSPATAPQSDVIVTPEIHVYIGNEEINNHITDVVDERDRRTKRSLTMGARRIV